MGEPVPFGERLAGKLEPLGAFSPLANLRTEGAGARTLLTETERAAERALHVARGILFAVILVVFILQIRSATALLIGVSAAAFAAATVFWLLVWRALGREQPPRWLPYVLVLTDAWIAVRGAVAVQTPMWRALGGEHYLTPSELAAGAGPILALVAITGAFRLIPRVAVYSTVVAVLSYAYITLALGVSAGGHSGGADGIRRSGDDTDPGARDVAGRELSSGGSASPVAVSSARSLAPGRLRP